MTLKKAFKRNLPMFKGMFTLRNIIIYIVFFFFLLSPIFAEIRNFLDSNSTGLEVFFVVFVIVCVWTYGNYYKTLGSFEEETKESGPASRTNVKIWSAFWIAWSVYCSVLLMEITSFDWQIFIAITTLAIIPGILGVLFSHQVRKSDKKQLEKTREKMGEKYSGEPYTLFTEKKYHSGYYGLICIPTYVIATIVGVLIRHFIR